MTYTGSGLLFFLAAARTLLNMAAMFVSWIVFAVAVKSGQVKKPSVRANIGVGSPYLAGSGVPLSDFFEFCVIVGGFPPSRVVFDALACEQPVVSKMEDAAAQTTRRREVIRICGPV